MAFGSEYITNTQFLLTIEDIEDSFILNFTTGRPWHTSCSACGTMENRPGFFDGDNDDWMCAVCMFDPQNDGKLTPIEK